MPVATVTSVAGLLSEVLAVGLYLAWGLTADPVGRPAATALVTLPLLLAVPLALRRGRRRPGPVASVTGGRSSWGALVSLYITYATIDPELIRRQFVPRLLGRDVGRTPFDADADAEALWDQARTALSRSPSGSRRHVDGSCATVGADGPSDAIGETTQLIMRLAILWSTAQLPYLGIEFRHAGAVVGPPPISEDPQPLFAHLVSAFPALDGAFGATRPIYPRAGSYAPPGLMPDLLAWLGPATASWTQAVRRSEWVNCHGGGRAGPRVEPPLRRRLAWSRPSMRRMSAWPALRSAMRCRNTRRTTAPGGNQGVGERGRRPGRADCRARGTRRSRQHPGQVRRARRKGFVPALQSALAGGSPPRPTTMKRSEPWRHA